MPKPSNQISVNLAKYEKKFKEPYPQDMLDGLDYRENIKLIKMCIREGVKVEEMLKVYQPYRKEVDILQFSLIKYTKRFGVTYPRQLLDMFDPSYNEEIIQTCLKHNLTAEEVVMMGKESIDRTDAMFEKMGRAEKLNK